MLGAYKGQVAVDWKSIRLVLKVSGIPDVFLVTLPTCFKNIS